MDRAVAVTEQRPGEILAFARTEMANERTLLSYIRTALTLFAIAVGLEQLLRYMLVDVVVGMLGIASVYTLFAGVRRYLRTRSLLRASLADQVGEQTLMDLENHNVV